MTDSEPILLSRLESEVFLKTLASALGATLPAGADQLLPIVIDAANGTLTESTQRLIKLSKSLDNQFRAVADQFEVNVSGLLRSVMAESIASGRAGLIAEQIRRSGIGIKAVRRNKPSCDEP